jgi:hypothetical protein
MPTGASDSYFAIWSIGRQARRECLTVASVRASLEALGYVVSLVTAGADEDDKVWSVAPSGGGPNGPNTCVEVAAGATIYVASHATDCPPTTGCHMWCGKTPCVGCAVGSMGAQATSDPSNYLAEVVTGPRAERVQLTTARAAAVGQSIICIVGHAHNADPANAVWDDAGNTYHLAAEHRKPISGDQPRVLIYYTNVTAPLAAGASIYWEVDVGSSLLATLETDSKAISAYLFNGSLSSATESGTASGFGGTTQVTVGGGQIIVAALALKAQSDTISEDPDWFAFDEGSGTSTQSFVQVSGGFRIGDTGGETWTDATGHGDWAMVGATFDANCT